MPFIGGASTAFFSGFRRGAITNPNILPNLQIWYDAADSSVFTPSPTNGSAITQWSDKSAFAHNANPSGGSPTARPTYRTNVQNNRSVLRFDGVANNLTINPAAWSASLSGFTIYMVAKASNLTGTRSMLATDQGVKIYHDGTSWVIKDSGGTGTSSISGDTTNFHIFGYIYNGTKATNSEKAVFRYDKSAQSLSFSGTFAPTTSSLTNRVDVGFFNNSEFFSGDIAEIIILSRAVSGSDIAALEGYLATKWGL